MENYSVKETSEILGITERAVQKRCKIFKVRKKDNKYLIDTDLIQAWKVEIQKANEPVREPTNEPQTIGSQTNLIIQSLEAEIESLKAELSQYEIEPNERIEVFTFNEYNLFEQRLKEWQTQRLEIEQQEKIFAAEKKSLDELYEHYKNQFHYQQKQNEKVLEMHQRLLDIISSQSKAMQERNLIEAVEKNIVDGNTWKPK